MYGMVSNMRMGSYPSRVALVRRSPGWVSTPCAAISTRRTTVFVPDLLDLQMKGKDFDLGMGSYPSRVALALQNRGWGFTVRSGIDPGGQPFFSPLCWSCYVLKDFRSEDEILTSPGVAVSTKPRLWFSKQPAWLGVTHRTGRYRPGGPLFSSPVC